jgi:polysaccharide deacetylase 2 family uncharacterized protein YibQ
MSTRPVSSSRFRARRRVKRKPKAAKRTSKIIFLILAVIVAALAIRHLWPVFLGQRLAPVPSEVKDFQQLSDRVDQALKEALDELGASPLVVTQTETELEEQGRRWCFRQLTIRVTAQISLSRCNLAITKAVQEAGGQVLNAEQGGQANRLIMELGVEDLRTHHLELISDENITPTQGRLAIIIDDFGAINSQVAEAFIQLPIPLTVAVIPGHETSQRMARQAAVAGHEVFIHLPMQPKEEAVEEENAILVDLPEEEIRRRVRWALTEIPEAVGVNNHMGSLATEDKEIMRAVLKEIKAADMFFVDSRTSPQSVAPEVAEELHLSCVKSDGFLDSQDDQAEIKSRLETLADRALQEGWAIGIGHIRANTLQALKDMIPRLEKKGVRFVHASRVLQLRS